MTDQTKDIKYEQLYTQLLERGEMLHENNKKRIRRGLIFLVILPVILGLILWITGSSKIVFLIIWILCMFATCAYLISIEYLDDSVQKTLTEVTDWEADFDALLPHASAEELQERIRMRIEEIREQRAVVESLRRGTDAAHRQGAGPAEPEADQRKEAELIEAEAALEEVRTMLEEAASELEAEEELEAIMAAGHAGKEDEK